MRNVHDRVYIGDQSSCAIGRKNGVVTVHACKTPCHQYAASYRGSLKSDHPNYLSIEKHGDLFLNLIDPALPLFKVESFKIYLDYAARRYAEGLSLLTHCNQGESRAPSLTLLFLAKKLGVIGNGSYRIARSDFEDLYPAYKPGKGIETFLTEKWQQI